MSANNARNKFIIAVLMYFLALILFSLNLYSHHYVNVTLWEESQMLGYDILTLFVLQSYIQFHYARHRGIVV